MVIADKDVVRKKVGNRSVSILPDDDIIEAIQASDVIVQSALNKFDWSVADPGYYGVKEVSELFASADILMRYQDTRDIAKEEYERAEMYLKILKDNFSATTGGEEVGNVITIVSPGFKTFPANPTALYKRPYGKGEMSEGLQAFTARTGDIV